MEGVFVMYRRVPCPTGACGPVRNLSSQEVQHALELLKYEVECKESSSKGRVAPCLGWEDISHLDLEDLFGRLGGGRRAFQGSLVNQ